MFEKLITKKDEALKDLNELVGKTNAEALLTCMIAQLLLISPEQNLGDEYGNHPAMLEVLAKVCIPKFGKNTDLPIHPIITNHCYGLLETIVRGNMFDDLAGNGQKKVSNVSSRLVMYSTIVRGSAYPEQTFNKINFVQGCFDNWYEKKIGISPSRTVELVLALIKRTEDISSENLMLFRKTGKEWELRYRETIKKKKITKLEQGFIDTFPKGRDGEMAAFCYGYSAIQNEVMANQFPTDLATLGISPDLSENEISAFKQNFCVNKESVVDIDHMQRKSFYELTSGEIIFSEISNGFDVIWDKFEEIAKLDDKFYSSRYQKKKANWLEGKTFDHLSKVFTEDCIYKNLTYPDPTKNTGTAELDLAVKWGPFLLVIEAKAKQFRFESIAGDAGRLRTDIKRNIYDSYDQSLRAIQYIEQNKECKFIEVDSKRELVFKSESIQRIFPISVSFHHLAGVATQLNELKDLGLFIEGKYPFSICESDLELLSFANLSADTFLHYISKRLSVLEDTISWRGDEIDLISAYLDCRLLLPNMMNESDQIPDFVSLGGYSKKFDQLMAFKRGEYPTEPEFSLSLPDGVERIFAQLKNWNDDGARWIAFALLELKDTVLISIEHAIRELKNSRVPHDGFRRMTFQQNDTVISIVGSSVSTFEQLKSNMEKRGLIEKHRRKAQVSIVFGVLCNGNDKVFDTADYIEFDWHESPEMEDLVAVEPAVIPSVIPGRNDPCFCGSGKKYKICCRIKVDIARRSHP